MVGLESAAEWVGISRLLSEAPNHVYFTVLLKKQSCCQLVVLAVDLLPVPKAAELMLINEFSLCRCTCIQEVL